MLAPEPSFRLWLERRASRPDGRIPAERALATELGLSRGELRKALAGLEADGRLVRQVGRGTFLFPPPGPSVQPFGLPGEPSSARSLADGLSPRHAVQARLALEPEIARLAAANATRRQLDSLADTEAAVAAAATWEAFDHADDAFHRAIATAAGNDLLLALLETVAAVRQHIQWGRLRQRGPTPATDRTVLAEHAAITAAIGARDGHAAADALRHHLLVDAAGIL